MPQAMTPGVMSDHALSKSKASSEPAINHPTLNSNKPMKDRAVSVGTGNENGSGGAGAGAGGGMAGGRGGAEGESGNGNLKPGMGRDDHESKQEEGTLDLSVLAPALPKIKQGFYPFKMLIGRLIQESHTQLRDLINSLQDTKEMDRRIALMQHVSERRQQFIKLLVLSIWAKRAEEVSQVIDVKCWFDSVEAHFLQAMIDSFALRRDLVNAKYVFLYFASSYDYTQGVLDANIFAIEYQTQTSRQL